MKQKLMSLGSSLKRTEIKKILGGYKSPFCTLCDCQCASTGDVPCYEEDSAPYTPQIYSDDQCTVVFLCNS
ncbi:MAG: hypothetical protein QM528_09590 [Phycisphaerales bacterium]|nr:hypothetical protein [Phycisphaerales bacterium]